MTNSKNLSINDYSSSPVENTENQSGADDTELERVREIIFGPDTLKQRFLKPETDRLRDILFGTHMEEYERQFSDNQRDIERLTADLRHVQDGIADFEKSQMRRLESLEREIRKFSTELRRQTKQIRAQQSTSQQLMNRTHQQELLAQRIEEQQKEHDSMLVQQEQSLREAQEKIESYRDQHERKLNTVKGELRQTEDKLYKELRRFTDRINTQKPDRKTLAAMFMEIATRLETGSSVMNLLEGLEAPSE